METAQTMPLTDGLILRQCVRSGWFSGYLKEWKRRAALDLRRVEGRRRDRYQTALQNRHS
jgi:hypothetical protein